MDDKQLAVLVKKIKSKDNDAFEIFYHYYFSKILGFVLKRTLNPHISEEIVSNIFFKILKKISSFTFFLERKNSLNAWIFKISENEIIEFYRGKKKQNLSYDDNKDFKERIERSKEYDDVNKINSEIDANLDLKKIKIAISCLSEKEQSVINLKYFAELNFKEIASIIKEQEGNIRVICHRAIKKIQTIVTNNVHQP